MQVSSKIILPFGYRYLSGDTNACSVRENIDVLDTPSELRLFFHVFFHGATA
jgi:hypothetical protein